jgi:anti-anti-sigma regulatory factor
MVLNVEIIKAGDFLKTTARGEFDLTKSKKLLHAIVTKAREHKDHHLLIDIRGTTSPHMGTIDLYNIVIEMEKHKDVLKNKIVVIDDDNETFNKMEFIEMCAKNRGFKINAVTDYEEAIQWLME